MSQLATVPLRSNIAAYTKAVGKAFRNIGKTEAEGTGALESIKQDLHRQMGEEGPIGKAYMMKKSETYLRFVAAIAGKGTAESLFKTLKKNPADKIARKRLDNLVLEDVDTVLKQNALTPEQVAVAGGRMF